MKMLKTVLGLAGAVALVLNAGCGSSDCGSGLTSGPAACPTPRPDPVTEVTTNVIYGDNGAVPAESGGYIEFGVPGAGQLSATVDWTFATSMVAIALTTGACDDIEAAFLGQCSHIAPANISRTQKPKTVSGTGLAGGGGASLAPERRHGGRIHGRPRHARDHEDARAARRRARPALRAGPRLGGGEGETRVRPLDGSGGRARVPRTPPGLSAAGHRRMAVLQRLPQPRVDGGQVGTVRRDVLVGVPARAGRSPWSRPRRSCAPGRG